MSPDERFVGKSIPTSEFTDDDGQPDPVVIEAMTEFAHGRGSRDAVLTALAATRLFVPVKAVLDSTDLTDDGHEVEKDSHMATVSIQTPDGRRALLAFTSVAAMAQWDADARPVAARTAMVAAAARDEGADAVIVDVTSDRRFVLESDVLAALSSGGRIVSAVADRAIQEAVMEAVGPVARARHCQFELSEPHGDADIRLSVIAGEGLDVAATLNEVAGALAASEALRAQLPRGVELGVR